MYVPIGTAGTFGYFTHGICLLPIREKFNTFVDTIFGKVFPLLLFTKLAVFSLVAADTWAGCTHIALGIAQRLTLISADVCTTGFLLGSMIDSLERFLKVHAYNVCID